MILLNIINKRNVTTKFTELTDTLKKEIERKWSTKVSQGNFDKNDILKKKKYILSMFPYPSGNLHMGHVRVYTIGDTIARYYRQNGYNVFQPIGFDAFGLPAENAAFERNIPANLWTSNNIEIMRNQLKSIGTSFNWDEEIITSEPKYFAFTQYIFLLMYREGLIYRKEELVNWDPIDKTVLADEQVSEDGKSWRSGAFVEKRLLKQWFIRTSLFANNLYTGLDSVELQNWKDIIKLQKHWIGKCDGYNFEFLIKVGNETFSTIRIWCRYPELLFKGCFVAVKPNSALDLQLRLAKLNDNEISILNPITNRLIPIFITNDVNYEEGCDTKIGLIDIDETDYIFAKSKNIELRIENFEENLIERQRVCELATDAGFGGYKTSSKLRDWLISRQRKWGTPIPIVYCDQCGEVPIPLQNLPFMPKDAHTCPRCSKSAVAEPDTMDTFVDSSWYFLRYLDADNNEVPYNIETINNWMPVDLYIGGKEHATLHLYYARFVCHFLHSIGLLKEPEPFKRLLVQGMVMGKTYKLKSGKYISSENVRSVEGQLIHNETGEVVKEVWEKMSKSKFNGVEPHEILEQYGIDTMRLFMLSDVTPESNKLWKSDAFPGIINWQQRLWTLIHNYKDVKKNINAINPQDQNLWSVRNFHVRRINHNYSYSNKLSVAIGNLQGLLKILTKYNLEEVSNSIEFEKTLASMIILLYPMAPHFTCELWSVFQSADNSLKWKRNVFDEKWLRLDDEYEIELSFSVNKAVKDTIKVTNSDLKELTKDEAIKLALDNKKIIEFIGNCNVLDSSYELIPNYEAFVNIKIDHKQLKYSGEKNKKKIKN